MDERDKRRPDDPIEADATPQAQGDVLGVSHVRPTGQPARGDSGGSRNAGADDLEGESTGNDDRSHVGTRDVTEGTTGGTGPDTGGAGALRKGSGATGTDIGK